MLPLALSPDELQLGRGETIGDTARTLSGYCARDRDPHVLAGDGRRAREWATVPVINALTDEHHPCQALADVLTIRERFGELAGQRLAFVGDGHDNVAHSLLEAGALTGLDVVIACPRELEPDPSVLAKAEDIARWTGANLFVLHDPVAAVIDADAVYTDVWTSMGEEREQEERERLLRPYQVTEQLMGLAQPDAVFLHCLPAKRGQEVSAAVIDGAQSVVWQQSANRLPTEAALLLALASDVGGWEERPE